MGRRLFARTPRWPCVIIAVLFRPMSLSVYGNVRRQPVFFLWSHVQLLHEAAPTGSHLPGLGVAHLQGHVPHIQYLSLDVVEKHPLVPSWCNRGWMQMSFSGLDDRFDWVVQLVSWICFCTSLAPGTPTHHVRRAGPQDSKSIRCEPVGCCPCLFALRANYAEVQGTRVDGKPASPVTIPAWLLHESADLGGTGHFGGTALLEPIMSRCAATLSGSVAAVSMMASLLVTIIVINIVTRDVALEMARSSCQTLCHLRRELHDRSSLFVAVRTGGPLRVSDVGATRTGTQAVSFARPCARAHTHIHGHESTNTQR